MYVHNTYSDQNVVGANSFNVLSKFASNTPDNDGPRMQGRKHLTMISDEANAEVESESDD